MTRGKTAAQFAAKFWKFWNPWDELIDNSRGPEWEFKKCLADFIEQAMAQARLEGVRLGLEAAAKYLEENFERGWDYENSRVILKKPDASTGYTDGMSYDHEDLAVAIRVLTPETVVGG